MKLVRDAFYVALFLFSVSAFAAYDNTWYQAEYWSGEYPNGFSIIKEGVVLPARTGMDSDLATTISCGVPFKANFSPWNQARPARYFTAAKIVEMTATEDLVLETDNGKEVKVAKGDKIEYLIYGAEGYFTVRYEGEEYGAGQDLLEKVTYDEAKMATPQEEWVNLDCQDGTNAWVFLRDLVTVDQEGDVQYLEGLGSWFLGFREYGVVTDLTDEDLKKQEP